MPVEKVINFTIVKSIYNINLTIVKIIQEYAVF